MRSERADSSSDSAANCFLCEQDHLSMLVYQHAEIVFVVRLATKKKPVACHAEPQAKHLVLQRWVRSFGFQPHLVPHPRCTVPARGSLP